VALPVLRVRGSRMRISIFLKTGVNTSIADVNTNPMTMTMISNPRGTMITAPQIPTQNIKLTKN
jgi:hypothetical protein